MKELNTVHSGDAVNSEPINALFMALLSVAKSTDTDYFLYLSMFSFLQSLMLQDVISMYHVVFLFSGP